MTTGSPAIVRVGIGQAHVGTEEETIEAILGSCLGVLIAWPKERQYALAHVLLPRMPSGEADNRYARYADTAPAHLLRRLRVPADRTRELRAILAGGASMYDASATVHIGPDNVDAGRAALRAVGVRVLGTDVGGAVGRRLHVDCATGLVTAIRMDGDDDSSNCLWSLR